MRVDIVRIGNSRGVRLPKAILDQCGFKEQAELEVRDGELCLRPIRRAREGWDEAFAKAVAAEGQDDLLMGDISNDFDKTEWKW